MESVRAESGAEPGNYFRNYLAGHSACSTGAAGVRGVGNCASPTASWSVTGWFATSTWVIVAHGRRLVDGGVRP